MALQKYPELRQANQDFVSPQNDQSVAAGYPWKSMQPWARQLRPAKGNV